MLFSGTEEIIVDDVGDLDFDEIAESKVALFLHLEVDLAIDVGGVSFASAEMGLVELIEALVNDLERLSDLRFINRSGDIHLVAHYHIHSVELVNVVSHVVCAVLCLAAQLCFDSL